MLSSEPQEDPHCFIFLYYVCVCVIVHSVVKGQLLRAGSLLSSWVLEIGLKWLDLGGKNFRLHAISLVSCSVL